MPGVAKKSARAHYTNGMCSDVRTHEAALLAILSSMGLSHLAPSFAAEGLTLSEHRDWDFPSFLQLSLRRGMPAAIARRLHAQLLQPHPPRSTAQASRAGPAGHGPDDVHMARAASSQGSTLPAQQRVDTPAESQRGATSTSSPHRDAPVHVSRAERDASREIRKWEFLANKSSKARR